MQDVKINFPPWNEQRSIKVARKIQETIKTF